jgi:hypothetical protein
VTAFTIHSDREPTESRSRLLPPRLRLIGRRRFYLHRVFIGSGRFFTGSEPPEADDFNVDWAKSAVAAGLRYIRSQALAAWAWARLDRELAVGLPPEQSDARRLRADQLCSPQQRRAIAALVRNILDAAEASDDSKPQIAAIVVHRGRLEALIELLRSDAPMTVRSLAEAELLACERHSPLLSRQSAEALCHALDEIAAANLA